MSKYKEIKTEFRNEKSLMKALEDIGYPAEKLEISQDKKPTIQLVGYHGDLRPERASIVIRRKYVGGWSNDVGFMWDGKTFQAIVSEYDSTPSVFGIKMQKLTQRYAYHEVKRHAKMNGYTTREVNQEDGSIRLVLQKR